MWEQHTLYQHWRRTYNVPTTMHVAYTRHQHIYIGARNHFSHIVCVRHAWLTTIARHLRYHWRRVTIVAGCRTWYLLAFTSPSVYSLMRKSILCESLTFVEFRWVRKLTTLSVSNRQMPCETIQKVLLCMVVTPVSSPREASVFPPSLLSYFRLAVCCHSPNICDHNIPGRTMIIA